MINGAEIGIILSIPIIFLAFIIPNWDIFINFVSTELIPLLPYFLISIPIIWISVKVLYNNDNY